MTQISIYQEYKQKFLRFFFEPSLSQEVTRNILDSKITLEGLKTKPALAVLIKNPITGLTEIRIYCPSPCDPATYGFRWATWAESRSMGLQGYSENYRFDPKKMEGTYEYKRANFKNDQGTLNAAGEKLQSFIADFEKQEAAIKEKLDATAKPAAVPAVQPAGMPTAQPAVTVQQTDTDLARMMIG